MKRIKKIRISEKVKMILLMVSVITMMIMFAVTVWDNLFHKDANTIRIEQEREERRLQREEWLKNME
ncbi:hypothetical protein [Bacillus thuringiensis]|uniref:hypothetical protein n=1 Tax=Bacillus cereus group TaxID=86661 RepID=UPI000BEB8FBD|nr:hypothetical protein [Bacillus thuringiensis]PEG10456.1 hypothetical protein CON96_10300 [Bacillus wiedmannii]PGT87520.1 hypothetical protein COD17_15705 [Bacillus thuringiensis]